MSDPRFARLKTDPRFRRIRQKEAKVVVDERFKSIFDEGTKSKKKGRKAKDRVDKYGRPLADDHEKDNLRRFYRLENEEEAAEEAPASKVPDYARGEVLLESSDEENNEHEENDDDSDTGGVVTLGRDVSKPIPVLGDDEVEIDLDEDVLADLDAQAAAYAKENPEADTGASSIGHTRRLAVVNLDWDHVRAIHLYKIFSSLVSPAVPTLPSIAGSSSGKLANGSEKGVKVVRGKVLSVRVYPSQFGKERMAKEEKEGPPPELFKNSTQDDEEEINEQNIYETGDGEDYNEDALRKYQLERLRYYYAIVECDTTEAASHIYSELDGTELERSANVFDLSFVPDDMTFDDDFRDEATGDVGGSYKALDFTTDALRHSKVKLTWDDDDPERNHITRRALSKKEIEENDFKAYLASSSSESEGEGGARAKAKDRASRDRLRALLLAGGDDTLPEGWGGGNDDGNGDVDVEITFTPGLSAAKNDKEETTLEKYQRKMKEKKKKRKDERKDKGLGQEGQATANDGRAKDDFFADDSDAEEGELRAQNVKDKGKKARKTSLEVTSRPVSTAEELALIAASDNPNGEAKHFDMKAVLKAEKTKGKKRRGKKGKDGEKEENELQEGFTIDVNDDRFKALHEDHTFAIDPTNPHFKKTKSMSALLDERSKRQKNSWPTGEQAIHTSRNGTEGTQKSLQSLVESVKRKSVGMEGPGTGKRRKL